MSVSSRHAPHRAGSGQPVLRPPRPSCHLPSSPARPAHHRSTPSAADAVRTGADTTATERTPPTTTTTTTAAAGDVHGAARHRPAAPPRREPGTESACSSTPGPAARARSTSRAHCCSGACPRRLIHPARRRRDRPRHGPDARRRTRQSFYDEQDIAPRLRLHHHARRHDAVGQRGAARARRTTGPYPTVVEYSRLRPERPRATGLRRSSCNAARLRLRAGVNIRGTGCSRRLVPLLREPPGPRRLRRDRDDRRAAVGRTTTGRAWWASRYPGISQLFVARTRPPHLDAITPLSVHRRHLPGHALPGRHPQHRVRRARGRASASRTSRRARTARRGPRAAPTPATRSAPTTRTAALPEPRPARPDRRAPNPSTARPRAARRRLARAGDVRRQDQRAGASSPAPGRTSRPAVTSPTCSTSSPVRRTSTRTMVNGAAHRVARPGDLRRGRRVPRPLRRPPRAATSPSPASRAAALVAAITGVERRARCRRDRFDGHDLRAGARRSSRPSRRCGSLFEEGGRRRRRAGLAGARATTRTSPVAGRRRRVATPWYLGARTARSAPEPGRRTGSRGDDYAPTRRPCRRRPTPAAADIWDADAERTTGEPIPDGSSASVRHDAARPTTRRWSAPARRPVGRRRPRPDTDLEVTLSEVRPDGNEVYVQSGWLRVSHRALDEAARPTLRPVHTGRGRRRTAPAGRAHAGAGRAVPVRPPVPRRLSRIRLTIHAPGGNRPMWAFDTTVARARPTRSPTTSTTRRRSC